VLSRKGGGWRTPVPRPTPSGPAEYRHPTGKVTTNRCERLPSRPVRRSLRDGVPALRSRRERRSNGESRSPVRPQLKSAPVPGSYYFSYRLEAGKTLGVEVAIT